MQRACHCGPGPAHSKHAMLLSAVPPVVWPRDSTSQNDSLTDQCDSRQRSWGFRNVEADRAHQA